MKTVEEINTEIIEATQRIAELKIEQERVTKHLDDLIKEKSNRQKKQQIITKNIEQERGVLDRYGNTICIGDTVSFLTKGKYKSKSGRIMKIQETRITAIDKKGNKINRAPHNTRVTT